MQRYSAPSQFPMAAPEKPRPSDGVFRATTMTTTQQQQQHHQHYQPQRQRMSPTVGSSISYPSADLLRWFRRKRYQYEVTLPLYMLTATEKFIFNSIIFLLGSLLFIAVSLYLPEHIAIIASRAQYYCIGK